MIRKADSSSENAAPLVSVLITSYNREKYISEAIESVLLSTFKDFELIIVDDCSKDRTFEIACEFVKKDNRVRVYRNESNLTQFVNRNKAAGLARGKYIKYVDSDDIIYPYTLEYMVKAMERYPMAGLGFCLTHGPCRQPLPYLVNPRDAYHQHYFEGGLLFVGPIGLIIRTDVFKDLNGFEEVGISSDTHFALKVASRYSVVAMPRDLFWWRVHEDQVTTVHKEDNLKIVHNLQFTKDLIRNYSPLDEKVNKKILFNLHKNYLRHVLRFFFKRRRPLIALMLLLNIRKKVYK